MNTRSTSNCKSADYCKTKSENTDAEVFVLPPNLLEKLGIKLDKIQSTDNGSTDKKIKLDLAVNNTEDHQENIETYYVNTDKPCNNESESSFLETASLMKESVFLSPTFVPTIANVIPGEVEIASIHKECKNESATVNQTQELVNTEKFLEPLSLEQELINKFEPVNTVQSEPLKRLKVHENCFIEINDDCCENNETQNIHEFIEIDNIRDVQESQNSLVKESQNVSLKPNENQENKKNKINIINDEIIDIAKINKLLNFDNNNVLTPVSVGMLLPPTKAHSNTFGSNELNVPKSGGNRPHENDTHFEKYESNCVNEENYIDAHNSYVDVLPVLGESNSSNDKKFWDKNAQFNNIELCPSVSNSMDAASDNSENIATELKADAQSKINSIVNCLDDNQDQDFQHCLVSAKSVTSSEISNDPQRNVPTDFGVKLQINSINLQEEHSISKENYNSLVEKKDVDDCNESCNSMTKENTCSVEQNKHRFNVETCSTLASNILSCNSNDTRNDSGNGIKKSKLCIQGVEKPGGRSKPEDSIAKLSCNRQNVNKQNPDIRNRKHTSQIMQPVKNTQLMQSRITYSRKRLFTNNDLVQNFKHGANPITKKMSEAHENQINDFVIDTVCKKPEYCLCSDFGQLRYYDEDSFYEHIHFWQHKNVACKPDLIFSIYDESDIHKYEENSTLEILHETPKESSHKICWNEVCDDGEEIHFNLNKVNQNIVSKELMSKALDVKKNNKHVDRGQESIDVEMSETDNNNVIEKYTEVRIQDSDKAGDVNEVVDVNKVVNTNNVGRANKGRDINTARDANKVGDAYKVKDMNKVENENIKTGKKRRRSLRVAKEEDESSLDHTKPFCKRDVKCGVCGQILTKQEWKEHLNKDHGFIAWKAGDIFDSQDKNMIKKVNQKLKDGVLKCTFCNSSFDRCEEYISHVHECTKNKVLFSSQVKKSNSSTSFTIIEPKKTRRLSKSCTEVEHITSEGDSSQKIEKDTTDTLTSPVKEKTLKGDKSYKDDEINTVTPLLKQKSECLNTPKKMNNDTATTLITSTKTVKQGHSNEKIHFDSEITSTPLTKETFFRVCNSSKMFKTYSKCTKRESFRKIDINNKNASTPLIEEESFKCNESPIKGDIDTKNISTTLLQEKAVKNWDSSEIMDIDAGSTSIFPAQTVTVKCGVCKQEMIDNEWIDHIQKAHKYLAWKEDESALDFEDENQVWHHLHLISKKCNGLVCSKCGLSRKYVKAYLSHIKQCNGKDDSIEADCSKSIDIDIATTLITPVKGNIETSGDLYQEVNTGSIVTPSFDNNCDNSPMKVDNSSKTTSAPLAKKVTVSCGVCKQEMDVNLWNDHMQKEHNYLAWKEGESSLDLQDKDQIWQHLHSISKKCDGLVCSKCGLNRKYVKSYLSHIKQCDGVNDDTEAESSKNMDDDLTSPVKENIDIAGSSQEVKTESTITPSFKAKKCSDFSMNVENDNENILTDISEKVNVKCGICKQEMDDSYWNVHMQKEHNYLAWKEGESPIDLQDKDQIWQHLHLISKKCAGLVCPKCGLNRKYVKAYLSHTKQCDGVDDSIETNSSKNVDINIATTFNPSLIEEIEKCGNSSFEESLLTPSAKECTVKCGVCSQEMDNSLWNNHMQIKHNYLAWKEGESSLDLQDKDQIWQHLHLISKKFDGLVCAKCGLNRKYVKAYLGHIKQCDGTTPNNDSLLLNYLDSSCTSEVNASHAENADSFVEIKCGVCSETCLNKDWIMHIQSKHDYLAWKEGEPPLNLQDQEAIENHLRSIIRNHGSLYCRNCGVDRKYGRRAISKFLQHIDISGKYNIDTKIEDRASNLNSPIPSETVVKCGVCEQDIEGIQWIEHIGCSHNYLAWKYGEQPLELDDTENVKLHFCKLSKQVDAFKCIKCGFRKKYPKLFIDHLETCDGTTSIDSSKNKELTVCAVCSKQMNPKEWISHSMAKHYNVAWRVGDHPIDLKSGQAVEKYLKEYKQVKGALVCNVCGKSRLSLIGFYAHVVICGKSEKEVKEFQNVCEICNKLYVCVYKYQHMMSHKEQMYRMQQLEKLKEENKNNTETILDTTGDEKHAEGRRRPDVKATDGLEQLKTDEALNNESSLLSYSMNESCTSKVNTVKEENVDLLGEIKCGVCSETCLWKNWIMHIQSEHDYLAWKKGEPPLNLQDQEAIENHLRSIIKKHGSLYCRNCGVERKYGIRGINSFLQHIKICGKNMDIEIEDENPILNPSIFSEYVFVKCGVCEQNIEDSQWIEHIGCSHNYLAWKHGEQPLDLYDRENVKLHFIKLSRQVDAFKCAKCGFRKKYPKLFIDHIETCNATSSVDPTKLKNTELIECAVCSKQMKPEEWRLHAMDKHYNVAWRVGDHPIDLKSCYDVEKYLKEYKRVNGILVCKICGISRVSLIGFYAHVLICGKCEEELDEYQNVCEICNKSYVCVYKNQHMKAHREQEYAKERKMQRLEKRMEQSENTSESLNTTGDENAVGRRRAAVKARNVIEKLKTDEDEQNNTCATCGFEAATARKLASHKCVTETFDSGSDTEDSYESNESNASNASNETDGSDQEAEVSEDDLKEEYISKKRRYRESIVAAKVPKLPFKYNKLNCYLDQNENDLFKIHFTDEILFPEWLNCQYEQLEYGLFNDYLPKVEQSCKIKLEEKWDTFNRFEVKTYNKGCSIFVGGPVKCLSWIPPRLDTNDQSANYLAVSCHQDPDTPRYNFDELATHSGVIQIWDFDNFNNALPKLVLCIAHDCGTVWAMDWCPSGVRDINAGDKACPRLGLLAVACSNGLVYIFSVPYPSSIAETDKIFFKLKPVAELRISMSSERREYQATAICWSKQKGHAIVMVGYADGTTALYDLCSTLPFLKSIDNGVTVFYPYHDRRDHNVCVTDVDICPTIDVKRHVSPGALCSTSLAGSAAQLRARAGQPRLEQRSPGAGCRFTPGWPSVLLAPDDSIATQSPNELDWYGCGRRLGPGRALSTCYHCSRVLVYSRPLLRYFDALPPYTDFKKQTVALITTSPLAKKRKITNDKLAMLVEPLTYDEVVTQYGVEVTMFEAHENNPSLNSIRESFTERFPLADVTALSFCAARAHHRVAAVGLHAGFVLIVTV